MFWVCYFRCFPSLVFLREKGREREGGREGERERERERKRERDKERRKRPTITNPKQLRKR